jgi:predicted metal-dependent peptidase
LATPSVEDAISRAAFDLLLREPFYAHVLAGLPREVSEQVETIGLRWDGEQVMLRVNPLWFGRQLSDRERSAALKHEALHVVFRHLFRPADRDPALYSIAADLVVNQLLAPLQPLAGWPTLAMFPELELASNQPSEIYYAALAGLLRRMGQAGYGAAPGAAGAGRAAKRARRGWAEGSGQPHSAEALAQLLQGPDGRGIDTGWHDGNDALAAAAGRYALGGLLLRARERIPLHRWGELPAALRSELGLILAERQPVLDWKRVVRLFCASSARSRLRHTVKRVSKRYGTRPGIKVQRLRRLLVALDTSGSIDGASLEAFFREIHGAWRAGATVHIIECDADVQRHYPYAGRPPEAVEGGGGTDFDPVFRWMEGQPKFDGCLYLTDGEGPAPSIRPRCRLLWVVRGDGEEDAPARLPFGSTIRLPAG